MGKGLAEWLRPAGYSCLEVSNDEVVVANLGWEVRWYIRQREADVTVSSAERAGSEVLIMAAHDLLDVERYLTFRLGSSTRPSAFRQHQIDVPWQLDEVAEGFAVRATDDADLRAVVLESGRERARFRDISYPVDAGAFTHYANSSVADLRASLRDQSGEPLFGAYVSRI
jgi:hypothetical protein